jgi:transcriptional regulator with XRE-family HTH domain
MSVSETNRPASFGEWLKMQRAAGRLSLRVFAAKAGIDPGNLSRYERGVVPPPRDSAVLERIGHALGLRPGSKAWSEMEGLAAIGGKRLPADVADDPELLKALPILFRSLKGKKLSRESLERLARLIQKS